MASGWLQSKGLLEVKDESVTSLVIAYGNGQGVPGKGHARDADHQRAPRRKTVHGQGRHPDLGHGPVRSELCCWRAQGGRVVRIVQGGILELVAGADISAYEFLSGLIKTVAEKEQRN